MDGRTTVVTGAAGGIGKAICVEMALAGSNVALFDIAEDAAAALSEQIAREHGIDARAYRSDVTDVVAVKALMHRVAGDFGSVDHVVNAHGIQYLSEFADFPLEKWKQITDVNFLGTFATMQAAWPHMLQRRRGRIVNIASVHGFIASPLKSAYIASKHAVVGVTRAAAVEGAPLGITVNAVCPGGVWTEMVTKQGPAYVQRFGGDLSEEEALARAFLDQTPTKRFVEPSEIAQLCVYLCSDAARSITGSIIPIDGGWTAH